MKKTDRKFDNTNKHLKASGILCVPERKARTGEKIDQFKNCRLERKN